MIWFKEDLVVDSKEEQVYGEDDLDKEDMEDFKLDNERGRHCRMVFEDKYGGVDNKKSLLHDKRWNVYVNEN